MVPVHLANGAPGVIVYNAVMGAPDRLLSSSVAHLQAAYSVDVISAIVVAQVAAPAMRAAGRIPIYRRIGDALRMGHSLPAQRAGGVGSSIAWQ